MTPLTQDIRAGKTKLPLDVTALQNGSAVILPTFATVTFPLSVTISAANGSWLMRQGWNHVDYCRFVLSAILQQG